MGALQVVCEFVFIPSGNKGGSMSIHLDNEIERGIQMVMAEYGVTRDEAIKRILRDWLTGGGYIPLPSED